MKGGAAEKAGIRKDDVVIAIDSTSIPTSSALQEKVNSYHPGDKAEFTVIRDGKEEKCFVTFLGDVSATGTVDVDGSIAFYGSKIRTADKQTLAQYRLKQGVEIVSVGEGKLLNAGAEEGFIITYVNEQPVSKAEDVIEIAKKSRRAIYIEGVTASGRTSYFAFGKDE